MRVAASDNHIEFDMSDFNIELNFDDGSFSAKDMRALLKLFTDESCHSDINKAVTSRFVDCLFNPDAFSDFEELENDDADVEAVVRCFVFVKSDFWLQHNGCYSLEITI